MRTAAWQLVQALWGFFYLRKYTADWFSVCNIGLHAARSDGELHGEARMLNGLGCASQDLGQHDKAILHLGRSVEIFRDLGEKYGEASTMDNLGTAYAQLHQFEEAARLCEAALAIRRQIDDRAGMAITLGNIAEAYMRLGRYGEALSRLHLALSIYHEDQTSVAQHTYMKVWARPT